MKKIIITTLCMLVFCSASAIAATSGATATDAVPVQTDSSSSYSQGNFNGWYVGAGTAYLDGAMLSGTLFSGLDLLGLVGYSHTIGRLYLGGELDAGGIVPLDVNSGSTQVKPEWNIVPSFLIGGLITPNLLFYGRFGFGLMGAQLTQPSETGSAQATDNSQVLSAEYLAGAGLGYSVTQRLNLRLEYDGVGTYTPATSLGNDVRVHASSVGFFSQVMFTVTYAI